MMKKIIINKQLLPMKAHYFLWNAGTGPVVPYLSSYARQLGFSSVIVGLIYTILPISGMLAKPLFGSVADRFRCQKILFLVVQLVTAAAFLSVFYSPQIQIERQVQFSCANNTPSFETVTNASLNNCSVEAIQKEITVDLCRMNCKVHNESIRETLCNDWKLDDYCNSTSSPNTFIFDAEVPKSSTKLIDKFIRFEVTNITLPEGTFVENSCPTSQTILTRCNVECNDYSINDIIATPAIEDKDVYGMYQFWTFLALMVVGWTGQAVSVSIGDAICFELLGDKPHRYGYQRLFGALGWGVSSLLAGFLIDVFSEGQSQKNYIAAFYMAAVFLVLDFLVSSRIKYTQKKRSSSIVRDVGRLLLNTRIIVYLLWCTAVGMCTGLIWQFLYWLIEDLAAAQGCDTLKNIKTLEGIVQAIQSLMGEIPFFFFSGWIIRKLGHVHTMSLVLFAIGVRCMLYSIISNPWLILPVEVMNGLTFGLFFACMASYASFVAPSGTEATMQGLVGAVFEGVGVSSGSALGGLAYSRLGGPLTFRYFGFGSLILCGVHIAVQYFLQLKDLNEEYCSPKEALEKVRDDDQEDLTYVDS